LKKRLPYQPAHPGTRTVTDEPRTVTVEKVADPSSFNLDAIWDNEWERNLTEAAKERVQQKVSAAQFQMFELYVAQGWPVREIVRMLSVSPGQVYLAKYRVGALLKKEVQRLQSAPGPLK